MSLDSHMPTVPPEPFEMFVRLVALCPMACSIGCKRASFKRVLLECPVTGISNIRVLQNVPKIRI